MSKVSVPSTQEHLPISSIQDSVLIMNDGSLRVVIKVEPINFELKSDTEQNAIIYGYQAFLNSLDFPIQIVIQSKKLDLERYLLKLDESRKQITNDLLRIQAEDYIDFVRKLISIANIMSKRFYVVVSYAGVTKSGLNPLTGLLPNKTKSTLYQDQFDRYRTEVFNRGNIILNGLSKLGVKVDFLDTQKLIELFYGIYNPDIATEERLTEIETLEAGVVSAPSVIDPNPPVATTAEQPTAVESTTELPTPTEEQEL